MAIQEATQLEVKGHGGVVARLDDDFLTISRHGFLARSTVGKGDKRIPVSQITAVQLKRAGPLMNGFLQITVAGANEVRSRFGHQTMSAVKDENSVVFRHSQAKQFDAFRDALEQAIAASHRSARPVTTETESIPDQIAKLGALRDSGILTADEFETKKVELLQRL